MNMCHLLLGFFWSAMAGFTQYSEEIIPDDLGPLLEPDPIPFSFSTPGWYALAVVLIISGALFLVKWVKNYNLNAYRRKAIAKVNQLKTIDEKPKNEETLRQLLTILKIVAVQAYGRAQVASLSGENWLNFLEAKGHDTPFTQYKQAIALSIYQQKKTDQKTVDEISDLTKKWIKTHA